MSILKVSKQIVAARRARCKIAAEMSTGAAHAIAGHHDITAGDQTQVSAKYSLYATVFAKATQRRAEEAKGLADDSAGRRRMRSQLHKTTEYTITNAWYARYRINFLVFDGIW